MNEIYFYAQTQTLLLEPTVNRKAQLDNFKGFSSVHKLIDNFNVLTTYGEPIEYLKLVFGLKESRPGVNYFGYFYFILLLSSLLFLTFKKIKKENMAIFIWLIAGFLVLEFFPIGIILENNEVNYLLIPKEGRFMLLLTIPTMLIISSSLTAIGKKTGGKYLIIAIISFLGVTSLLNTAKIHSYFEDGIKDTKEVSKLVPKLDKTIYTDHLAKGEIDYFTGFKYENRINNFFGIQNKTQLKDSYIIVGGARGVDIYWKVVVDDAPEFIKEVVVSGTDQMILIEEIRGEETGYRKYSLRVYYVP